MKILTKGNQAIAEAALRAHCVFYAGYPITPQNEIPEYMAKEMPKRNGIFIQSESEIAAINMVYGAAATGVRAMTSSSSPGFSLKQECISYMAASELPCVIVNMARGGPGLGNITGAQSDYFQAVKGGGHGDYRLIVLSPSSVQEAYDLTMTAFDLADIYRNPVLILGDGYVGQMVEPLELKEYTPLGPIPVKDWALTGCRNRNPNVIKTLLMQNPEQLLQHNLLLQEKFLLIRNNVCMYEEINCSNAEIILVAYGISARICKGACTIAAESGIRIGLLRVISLWPFPAEKISSLAKNTRKFLVVEISSGQLIEDVKLAVNGKSDVLLYGLPGGWLPTPEGIVEKAKNEFMTGDVQRDNKNL